MKTVLKIQLITVVILCMVFGLHRNIFAQVSRTVIFDTRTLSTEHVTAADNNVYTKIQMDELRPNSDPGTPALPVKVVKLIIPANQEVSTIDIDSGKEVVIKLSSPVMPMQPEPPVGLENQEMDFVPPQPEIYQGTSPFPKTRVQVIHQGYFDGANHIVTIGISPVQYYPVTSELHLCESISFTLNFKSATRQPVHVQSRKQTLQPIYDNILEKLVANTQDLPLYKATIPTTKGIGKLQATATMLPVYDYVIITSEDLASTFDTFMAWKTRKGYDVGVVTTADIYSAYPGGDLISGIGDHAGSIRQYLSDAYQQGTVYALLGGDYSVVPVRKGDELNNSYFSDGHQIVADIYFADFNGDWNVDGPELDGQNRYGEKNDDDPDYNPEIFVGRLPCTNVQDIENWTEKVLTYELNPGDGDFSYLDKAYWFQGEDLSSNPNNVTSHYPPSFTHTVWSNGIEHNGSEVVRHMSNNQYGLIHWYAHGSPNSIQTRNWTDPHKCVYTADDYCSWGECSDESGDGLDSLMNGSYYSINYSISCDIANPANLFISDNPGRSMGEGWTVMYPNNGGPALLGNTLAGWSTSSVELHKKFADLIDDGGNDWESGESYYHLGVAELVSKSNFVGYSRYHYLNYSHNLMGCPETRLNTQSLSTFNNVAITDNGL